MTRKSSIETKEKNRNNKKISKYNNEKSTISDENLNIGWNENFIILRNVSNEFVHFLNDALRTLEVLVNIFIISCTTYTYVLVLIVIYLCGLTSVNVLNAIYLLFFVVFIINSKWRKRYWRALVVYASCVVFFKYIWKCFPTLLPAQIVGLTDGPKKLEMFGLFFSSGTHVQENQIDFFFSFIILMFSSWQLTMYSTNTQRNGQ